jgi:hypothetical protein
MIAVTGDAASRGRRSIMLTGAYQQFGGTSNLSPQVSKIASHQLSTPCAGDPENTGCVDPAALQSSWWIVP